MLNGFTAPRSALGAAALVPSPPWHFAGDVLAVEFWNDPDVSVDTLPTGVELDKKCPGHSVALFADCQFTAQNNEFSSLQDIRVADSRHSSTRRGRDHE